MVSDQAARHVHDLDRIDLVPVRGRAGIFPRQLAAVGEEVSRPVPPAEGVRRGTRNSGEKVADSRIALEDSGAEFWLNSANQWAFENRVLGIGVPSVPGYHGEQRSHAIVRRYDGWRLRCRRSKSAPCAAMGASIAPRRHLMLRLSWKHASERHAMSPKLMAIAENPIAKSRGTPTTLPGRLSALRRPGQVGRRRLARPLGATL
jgi:hypothetical protein